MDKIIPIILIIFVVGLITYKRYYNGKSSW